MKILKNASERAKQVASNTAAALDFLGETVRAESKHFATQFTLQAAERLPLKRIPLAEDLLAARLRLMRKRFSKRHDSSLDPLG